MNTVFIKFGTIFLLTKIPILNLSYTTYLIYFLFIYQLNKITYKS